MMCTKCTIVMVIMLLTSLVTYAPINIRPHYHLDGQGWGLVGDLTAFDLKNRPKEWGI